MMKNKSVGLYVHIPFCKRKCNYCDFCSFADIKEEVREKYLARLTEEIRSYRGEKLVLQSVFIGGGTPSLLTLEELTRLMCAIRETFEIRADAEITIEVNPGTLDPEGALAFLACGINRVSMGLQSIHENELKILGRIHTYEDFLRSYRILREVGFTNINVDIMYAIPEQSVESFGETIDAVAALSPEHISAYSLIVEENTPFGRMRDSLSLPDEDTELSMYALLTDRLSRYGYSHYEISNYAKRGKESRHNLIYWHDKEYIGVGLSAYSFYGGVRFGNSGKMDEYLSDHYAQYQQRETIDPEAERFEYAMLALRLSEGISLSEYEARFGESFLTGRLDALMDYQKRGLLTMTDDRIALTEQGFYVSNTIFTEIL